MYQKSQRIFKKNQVGSTGNMCRPLSRAVPDYLVEFNLNQQQYIMPHTMSTVAITPHPTRKSTYVPQLPVRLGDSPHTCHKRTLYLHIS